MLLPRWFGRQGSQQALTPTPLSMTPGVQGMQTTQTSWVQPQNTISGSLPRQDHERASHGSLPQFSCPDSDDVKTQIKAERNQTYAPDSYLSTYLV